MHIVHLLASMQTGGSELVVLELAAAAVKQGHQVTVFSAAGDLCPRLHASGAEHLHWPVGKKNLHTLKLIRRLTTWLEENPADILHAHSRLPAWIAWKAIQALPQQQRPHFITSVHGHYSVSKYSAIMTYGEKIIAVSGSIARYICKNYPQVNDAKIVVIPPGVDHLIFNPQHKNSPAWTTAFNAEFPSVADRRLLMLPGRITRLKGHKCFVRLLAGLIAAGENVHGLIVGPMSAGKQHYLDEISELALDLGISEHLDYAGNREDMADLMLRADLVLNLSIKAEAFGRTVNEALSVGTQVVAWDRGGVSELLGELFPQGRVEPGNESDLLKTCTKLLRQPEAISNNQAYSLAVTNSATLDLYTELCQ
ncbi:MAG: glycosyltransferase [Xanthomonadales bacterium]|nr:glycosyltransferase [Xanthomonadales bacterium]